MRLIATMIGPDLNGAVCECGRSPDLHQILFPIMTDNTSRSATARSVDIFIRLVLLGGLLTWCALIMAPFVSILLWSVILAVALFPFFQMLTRWMGGRQGLAATMIVGLGLSLIAIPGYFTGRSLAGTAEIVADYLQKETLHIPELPAEWYSDTGLRKAIADRWPTDDSALSEFVVQHTDELRYAGNFVFHALAGFSVTLLMFIVSIVIAGILMHNAKRGGDAAARFLARTLGQSGSAILDMAANTVRNVAKGILGVALIQTTMLALGLFIAGVPAAGLLTVVGLALAVVQIGIGPVVLGVIIYAFADMDTLPAILLTIWLILTTLVDNVLKPILMGRGSTVPTLVIFLGAIGGFMLSGIIGLFTGAVVLSIGYRLALVWMDEGIAEDPGRHPNA
jgi:predicted PurR-regulated permease PerM